MCFLKRGLRAGILVGALILCAALLRAGTSTPTSAATPASAATPTSPHFALSITSGRDHEGQFDLVGNRARQQLLVTGGESTADARDLTREVQFTVEPATIVSIDAQGVVRPLQSGTARITATHSLGGSATISATVKEAERDEPVNFPTQVTPIFTKLACNGGGCHGKSGGQNGFAISLLGFVPTEDYEAIVHEAHGRRLSIASPDQSLLLLKATGSVPHGGGKRLEVGEPAYDLIHRWIAAGAQPGNPEIKRVTSIETLPNERIMQRNAQQQLVVIAHYADGTAEDVSQLAQYKVSDPEMAQVSVTGLVSTADRPGDVAVMVSYQSQVSVFRAILPLGAPIAALPTSKNFIDDLVVKKLRLLGLPPSKVCDDSTFLRRVTIDIAGRLPTQDEAAAFLHDASPDKRDRLIERLATSSDCADNFANKWSAILRNQRNGAPSQRGAYGFHRWIRQALLDNMSYDEFVNAIVAASGESGRHPPVVWYRQVNDLNKQVEDTAQLFLGLRIQCARCHHHPMEKWSQDDYYGFAAFFARIGRKPGIQPGETRIVHEVGQASAVNPKTGEARAPTGFGAKPLSIAPTEDPRKALVAWMTEPNNPFFARALVNRYWKHFFGRGLVDPEDDIRVTNPATNPELLDALAAHFVSHGFDLQNLIKTICQSQIYQLDSEPNEFNAGDRQNFSRWYPRRLPAEVLHDAVDALLGQSTKFAGVPVGTRAVQLPDSGFDSYFLSVFGRPQAQSVCECERSGEASLAQSLHLMNSELIHQKLSSDEGSAARLASDAQRSYEDKVRDVYLSAFAREPMPEERDRLVAFLSAAAERGEPAATRQAYEDALWALVNTKEFLYNH